MDYYDRYTQEYMNKKSRRMDEEFDAMMGRDDIPIKIFQSATSNDAGQKVDVTYNHYEIHIHIPENANKEHIGDIMNSLKNPTQIKEDTNTTIVKKSKWWDR